MKIPPVFSSTLQPLFAITAQPTSLSYWIQIICRWRVSAYVPLHATKNFICPHIAFLVFFFFLLPSPPCSNPSNHILLPSSINVMCYYTCSNAALFCCRVAMICSSPAHHVYTQRVELGKCRAICSWWWLCACMMMMREAKERYRERKTALAHERVMWLATVTHRSPTWSESSIMYHTHSHANNIHEKKENEWKPTRLCLCVCVCGNMLLISHVFIQQQTSIEVK